MSWRDLGHTEVDFGQEREGECSWFYSIIKTDRRPESFIGLTYGYTG